MAPRFAFVPARWLAADSGLVAADRLVLCVLCQWVNRESGECFPSVSTIADHSKLGENTIRASIKRLVEVGAVAVERRKDEKGDPASNLYTVLGYDPPAGRGTSIQRVPVPQIGGYGGSNQTDGVPQSRHPNVVKENNEVNGTLAADSASASSASVALIGPRDLFGRPFPELKSTPPTDEERSSWREKLRAVGIRDPNG